ncbi:MAG: LysR family transcriptional regulator, partial [Hyphomicrobiaceae bacterium]|nr:LysR family transcriptional regulator [Hyphomicrobiaceae bacterium]
ERLRLGLRRLTAPTPDNVLVVSTGPSFAAKWLAPRLFRFMDLHPEIEVRISASLKLVDFRADEVDVAVRFGRGPYEGLEQRRILGETVTVLASPGFLAAHSIAHPQDLLALPLIHDESMRFDPDAIGWVEWFAAQGITVGEVRGPRFNHADHALDAAVRGSGATLGRTTVAAEDMRNGLLVEPFPERRIDTDMAFFLVAPQAALARPKVKAFSDWIMAETAGDPPV